MSFSPSSTALITRFRRTVALCLLLAGLTVPAHAQFGITGGLNFESADDITVPTGTAGLDNSTGIHAGIVYDFGFGPINVRPGLLYRQVGSYEFESLNRDFDVTTIEVPVDLRVTVLPLPVVRPYLLAGPQFSFVRGEDNFDDATEDLSFSVNVGLGAELRPPFLPLILQPELRYEIGATTFIEDDFTIGGRQFSPQDDPRFSAFSLRLNVLFSGGDDED